ncbi:MAG TPA: hypothetical protein ENK11_02860 [Phycisphaerales bacterium]|nr:hypothetical protein [Phycisphaerales bacterium]
MSEYKECTVNESARDPIKKEIPPVVHEDAQIRAMMAIIEALRPLDEVEIRIVLTYINYRFSDLV